MDDVTYLSVAGATIATIGVVALASNLLSPRTKHNPVQAVKHTPRDSWRHADHAEGLAEYLQDEGGPPIDTMAKAFRRSVAKFPNNRAFGTRETLKEETVTQNGKDFVKLTRGEYSWITYAEANRRINSIGSGLMALGLKPGSHVAIFADTCTEWQLVAHACFRFKFVVVTVYATLGDEALVHAFKDTDISCVFTQSDLVDKTLKYSADIPSIQHVVYFGDWKGSAASSAPITLEKVQSMGSETAEPTVEVSTNDNAVIMFTSGSTSLPKGVVMNHSNLVAAMVGISACLPDLSDKDVYIGYLPLAHVLELIAENCLLSYGGSIGYAGTKTLSDASPMVKAGTKGDVSVLKPTIMAAVPAIMERIRKAVHTKVEGGSWLSRNLFNFAYSRKLANVEAGQSSWFWDTLIFQRSTRPLLGGRVRLLVSGGAPLEQKTERFMNVCFCCHVSQGYGLTETCGGGTVKALDDQTTGRAGRPIGCAEVRLMDWEEGGYTSQDKPFPRGEIWIGGPHITQGYWKLPEKTSEEFIVKDGQRWFATGDIGQIEADGALRIVDRKKDLVKLEHGEYISLGKVEAALKTCRVVENICVYAESKYSYCLAIVFPQEVALRKLAANIGEDGDASLEDLCANDKVRSAVTEALEKTGKGSKLHKFEIPKKIHLTAEEWTSENGLVTAALKIRRHNIRKHYQGELDALYQS